MHASYRIVFFFDLINWCLWGKQDVQLGREFLSAAAVVSSVLATWLWWWWWYWWWCSMYVFYYMLTKCCGVELKAAKDVCWCVFFFLFFFSSFSASSRDDCFSVPELHVHPLLQRKRSGTAREPLWSASVHAPRCKPSTTWCFFTHTQDLALPVLFLSI